MVIEASLSVGFRTAIISTGYRPYWNSDETSSVHFTSRRLFQFDCLSVNWNKVPRLIDSCSFITRTNNLHKNRIRVSAATAEDSSGKSNYHPFEEIGASIPVNHEDAQLTPAETTRTLIEVNSKATLMFSGLIDDNVQENIFWPDLPYLTDEHGNIYFEVNNEVDVLKTLNSQENYVQVIIGMDTKGMFDDVELGPSGIGFDLEEIEDEDDDEEDEDGDDEDGDDNDDEEGDEDDDDDYDSDWVSIDEDEDSDESVGDWAKLETMRSSHPMYFAKKMAEVTSDVPIDCMDQDPSGLVIQGLIRASLIEENSVIRKQIPDNQSSNDDSNQTEADGGDLKDVNINGDEPKSTLKDSSKDGSNEAEELEKPENLSTGTSFYKLEMVKIQLVSAHGNERLLAIAVEFQSTSIPLTSLEIVVEVEDFQKAQPDAIAHSAAKIVARLKAGGEKTTQALKSLCNRVKGIQVEEVTVVGVDSLGFYLRVCSGTQVQTLRIAFNTRATSEYSAERQLHDLMYPKISQMQKPPLEAGQKES